MLVLLNVASLLQAYGFIVLLLAGLKKNQVIERTLYSKFITELNPGPK